MSEDAFEVGDLSDALKELQTPNGQKRAREAEIAFRRGFHHGAITAIRLAAKMNGQQLENWLDDVQEWREAYIRGEQTEYIAPGM